MPNNSVPSVKKNEHENFEVTNWKQHDRIKIVRQDRYEAEQNTCFIEIEGKSVEITNYSAFGVALSCALEDAERFEKKYEFDHVPFLYANTELQSIRLRFVRKEKIETNLFRVAFEILGEPLITDRIEAVRLANALVKEHVEHGKEAERVPTAFRLKVYQIKDWLEVLQKYIIKLEEKIPTGDNATRVEYEQTAAQIIYSYLKQVFPAIHAELPKTIGNASPEEIKSSVEFLRSQLKHLIYQAPFSSRAFFKPRGYAGDYEMMNHLYRDEYAGDTLFAKCLHHYFINEPAGQAVRNRATYLESKILQTFKSSPTGIAPKFLSVASGPAMEVQLFIKNHPEFYSQNGEFHCLDQDEESLKFAQRQIRSMSRDLGAPFEYRFINRAIKNVIMKGLEENEYDLIYSAGLFDYLSDPVATVAASRLAKSLKKGGRLIIGNFGVDNPTLPLMNLAWDWQLIYRSHDDLRRLFEHVGVDMTVEQEKLGINLFCIITK